MFAKAADIKIDIIGAMAKLNERALDLQKIKQLFDLVITELRAESPELCRRVLDRFRGLDSERGFTDYSPPNGENNAG